MPVSDVIGTGPLRQPGQRSTEGPVWAGPESNAPNGGITFSLLSRFLVCRERFRLLVVEGLKPRDGFNHRLEFGNLWHAAEEGLAAEGAPTNKTARYTGWRQKLNDCARALTEKYPMDREAVLHWYEIVKRQFPVYVDYWGNQVNPEKRTPVMQEQVFHVAYTLPSKRTVYLRGKWDRVDLVGEGNSVVGELQENKTKGDIDERNIKRNLTFDLQTMLYLVALVSEQTRLDDSTVKARLSYREGKHRHYYPIRGVLYNVVRRPLSGGRGTIKRHEPTKKKPLGESQEEFYSRLVDDYIKKEPEHYFMRWQVSVRPEDIKRFRRECLDPILEGLCRWWDHVCFSGGMNIYGSFHRSDMPDSWEHFRMPYGVYNPLLEGNATELDEYLHTGSKIGLNHTTNLFPELSS